jgi:hypothetical protein
MPPLFDVISPETQIKYILSNSICEFLRYVIKKPEGSRGTFVFLLKDDFVVKDFLYTL